MTLNSFKSAFWGFLSSEKEKNAVILYHKIVERKYSLIRILIIHHFDKEKQETIF